MRYPVEKIKEALLSPNERVRKLALKFFIESYSEDPEIMLMILQSIEKYGIESIGSREIEKLKQTDETIGSVVRLFESGQLDKATESSHRILNNLIAKADINLIKPYTERIFQCVSVKDQTREVLQKRLAMAEWDEDRAWAELEAYNRDEMEKEIEYDEVNKVEYYLDALVNTGVRQSSRVMEALKRPYESIEDDFDQWMLPSYAELAGLLKMKEAIPFLVKLLNEDDDFLQESCANSLMRIGTTEIVGMLADQYETGEDYFKTFAAEIIATIQSDESIALTRRLLEIEDDSDQIEFLLHALLMQFDPDQLQFVYDRMVADELDPGVFDLYEYLIEISDLTGVRFKGYEELLPRVEAEKKQQKEMMEQIELEMRARTQLFEEINKKRLNVEVDSGFIPANTIVNETNRVGRNDTCPCGSGKKFKKCCMNKSG